MVGHLERSGTNYDTCVFMTYETAQEIMSSENGTKPSAKDRTAASWCPL